MFKMVVVLQAAVPYHVRLARDLLDAENYPVL